DAAGEPIQLILSDTPEGIKQDLLGKLAELQARKGHMDVTADVLHDNHIKQLGIHFMQKPLYLAHLTVLECAKNRKDNIQLQASWANQAWVTEIEAMFQLLEDEE
ncbi:Trank1, partial [Symbiodinium pilosum]